MRDQAEKAEHFRALHNGPGILVLPNAYDFVSARILADTGFKALATTSGGCAFTLGYRDGENMLRDDMAEVVAGIVAAVEIPVSADMEAGYGTAPDAVADTVRATINTGAVGINIEDSTKRGPRELIEFDLAVERIRSARMMADNTNISMVINARTDVYSLGSEDESDLFHEAVRRANAYLEVGADSAFVIGVRDGNVIGQLAAAIDGPLNILAGAESPSVAELEALGVRRVTVGSGFAKAAFTQIRDGAKELQEKGTYEFTRGVLAQLDIHRILKGD